MRDECLVEEHTQQPHRKKQPCLIVTTPKHYPRKKRSVFDIHHLVSQYWVYMSWSPWWLGFIRLNTHSQTDGQLFVRARRIIRDRLMPIPFYALNSNEGICVRQWQEYMWLHLPVSLAQVCSINTVADKLNDSDFFCLFLENNNSCGTWN